MFEFFFTFCLKIGITDCPEVLEVLNHDKSVRPDADGCSLSAGRREKNIQPFFFLDSNVNNSFANGTLAPLAPESIAAGCFELA